MIAGVSFDKDLPQFSPPRAALPTGRQKRNKSLKTKLGFELYSPQFTKAPVTASLILKYNWPDVKKQKLQRNI